MTDTVTCISCGAQVQPAPGGWCPVCMGNVAGPGGLAAPPVRGAPPGTAPQARGADASDPTARNHSPATSSGTGGGLGEGNGADVHVDAGRACATPGCTGTPAPGMRHCFTCELEQGPTETTFELTSAWGSFAIAPGETLMVGRDDSWAPATASFLAQAQMVSRRHASLRNVGGTLEIVDVGSGNGTTVNGRRIPPDSPTTLLDGDTVILGTQVQLTIQSDHR